MRARWGWRSTSSATGLGAGAAALALLALAAPLHGDPYRGRYGWPVSRPASDYEDWHRPRILADAGVALAVLPDGFKRDWERAASWGFGLLTPWTRQLDLVLGFESAVMAFDAGAFRRDLGLPPTTVVRAGSASVAAALLGLRIHSDAEGLRPYGVLAVGLPEVSRPTIDYVDPVLGLVTVPGSDLFGIDPCFALGGGLEWFRPTTWGGYLEARFIDAPGRTEPAHAWASLRGGIAVRAPRFFR